MITYFRSLPISLLAFAWLIAGMSCGNNVPNAENTKSSPAKDSSEPLYPFTEFIRNEVSYLDSIPLSIIATYEVNGRQARSSIFTNDSLKPFVQAFLEIDPNLHEYRSRYREHSFLDATLYCHTFVIEARDNSLPLARAIVQVDLDTEQVKSVALEKIHTEGGQTTIIKLLWRSKKGLQQTTLSQDASGQPLTVVVNVSWGE